MIPPWLRRPRRPSVPPEIRSELRARRDGALRPWLGDLDLLGFDPEFGQGARELEDLVLLLRMEREGRPLPEELSAAVGSASIHRLLRNLPDRCSGARWPILLAELTEASWTRGEPSQLSLPLTQSGVASVAEGLKLLPWSSREEAPGIYRVDVERGPLRARVRVAALPENRVRAEVSRPVAIRSPATAGALARLARECRRRFRFVYIGLEQDASGATCVVYRCELPGRAKPAHCTHTALVFVLVAHAETRRAVRALQTEAVARAYRGIRFPRPGSPPSPGGRLRLVRSPESP